MPAPGGTAAVRDRAAGGEPRLARRLSSQVVAVTTYDRGDPTDCEVIDRWPGGVGWLAHPGEDGRRASHAVVGEEGGVWVIDPLDAPGVDEVLATLGEVAGVVVCSNYHVRDAAALAARHDVSVHVPRWLSRATDRLRASTREASTVRVDGVVGSSGLRVRRCAPLPGWSEAVARRESDGTLYVPDVLGTAPLFTVGDERLGTYLLCRLSPPRDVLGGLSPERVLVGHGTGVLDDAAAALDDALAGARRRLPAALRANGRGQLRALVDALGA